MDTWEKAKAHHERLRELSQEVMERAYMKSGRYDRSDFFAMPRDCGCVFVQADKGVRRGYRVEVGHWFFYSKDCANPDHVSWRVFGEAV